MRSPRKHAYKLISSTPNMNNRPANICMSPSKILLTANNGVVNVINDKNSDNNVVAYFKLFSPL